MHACMHACSQAFINPFINWSIHLFNHSFIRQHNALDSLNLAMFLFNRPPEKRVSFNFSFITSLITVTILVIESPYPCFRHSHLSYRAFLFPLARLSFPIIAISCSGWRLLSRKKNLNRVFVNSFVSLKTRLLRMWSCFFGWIENTLYFLKERSL